MGIRTTTARLYFLLPYPSHIGTLDVIAPRRRVCLIAPILIPIGTIKMVAEAGFEPAG